MLQYNTLIVHVARLKELPIKGRHHLDAYASLNVTGTDKWRSKVATQTNRVDENGNCHWDEHLEFQLNENYTDLTININHKSKIGSSETLASMTLRLGEMPQIQSARWFQLHKKGHPEKLKGMLLMSYEFKNVLGGLSISQMSLNTIGKENKLDKLKRRMNFGRKKAKMDAQSMISVSMSRRSSICSNTSALAFSPIPSPVPPHRHSPPPQQDRISLPPDPEPKHQQTPNHLTLPNNHRYNEKRLSRLSSTNEDAISQYSNVSNIEKKSSSSRLAAKFRQKADKLLHIGSNRKSVDEFHDSNFVANVPSSHSPVAVANSRPQSIASSSGFASIVSTGNLDNLNDGTSKDYLLQIIMQLRKELGLKEQRINDLETYTGQLLSKIMTKHPDILQVN